MKTFIFIEGDVNDGDCVESFIELKKDEDLKTIQRVARAINNCKQGHNWPYYDSLQQIENLYDGILTKEEIATFIEYIPSSPYDDSEIHTIEEIKIFEVADIQDLL